MDQLRRRHACLSAICRVDFLGPPAIGKSTIIQSLLGEQGRMQLAHAPILNWVSMEVAVKLAEEAAYRTHIPRLRPHCRVHQMLKLLVHGIRNYLWLGHPKPFPFSQLETFQNTLLQEFIEQHHTLFEAIINKWFEPEITLPPLSNRYHDMLSWTSKWAFANTCGCDVGVLADNSRLTRGIAELLSDEVFCGSSSNLEAAQRFMLSRFGPSGIVHIEADPEIVLRRVHQRANSRSGFQHIAHRYRSDEEIMGYVARRNRVNSHAVGVFRSWDVSVLTIDGSLELFKTTELVRQFLATLSDRAHSDSCDERTGRLSPFMR